jgi:hypothetical protein
MTIDAARARACLDALHALGAMGNAATPVHCRLMTTVGSATSNGTELATSGGYTSGTGAPSITFGAASSPATSASTTAVTVTNMPATTINGIEIWDTTGTPVRQELGSLTVAKTTASGDTLSFAIGAITSALA